MILFHISVGNGLKVVGRFKFSLQSQLYDTRKRELDGCRAIAFTGSYARICWADVVAKLFVIDKKALNRVR